MSLTVEPVQITHEHIGQRVTVRRTTSGPGTGGVDVVTGQLASVVYDHRGTHLTLTVFGQAVEVHDRSEFRTRDDLVVELSNGS